MVPVQKRLENQLEQEEVNLSHYDVMQALDLILFLQRDRMRARKAAQDAMNLVNQMRQMMNKKNKPDEEA